MIRSSQAPRACPLEELLPASLSARLDALDIRSRKVFFGKLKGERRSKKRGESVEFADHRPYVLGDDTRHLDWNIYGRLDRLFLKLFLEEEDLSLHIVVDATSSMDCGSPTKFALAQRLAMAMGYVGLRNLHRVAATSIGGARLARGQEPRAVELLESIRDLRGRRRLAELAGFLGGLAPAGGPDFARACERIAATRRGKGVMVVLSDFFFKEGYEAGLKYLVGHGYDVYCVQLLSPQELEPAGPGGIAGDLRLRDAEDQDLAEVTVSAPLLKRYKANLSAYIGQLREFCHRRDMQLLSVRTDASVEQTVLDHFRKSGLVR